MAVCKRFGVDFDTPQPHDYYGKLAFTLPPESVCEESLEENDVVSDRVYSRTHPSGWTISAELHADYYLWVSDFEAIHAQYGRVWGAFADEVCADSEEGFAHFFAHHEPEAWDFWEI